MTVFIEKHDTTNDTFGVWVQVGNDTFGGYVNDWSTIDDGKRELIREHLRAETVRRVFEWVTRR